MTVRIIVADDHLVLRQGVCAIIERDKEMKVIAEAQDGQTAVELAEQLNPDVIIIDIGMPKMNGIEAIRGICRRAPDVKPIVLSMHSDKRFISRAITAGAKGYLVKDCASSELLHGIRAVIAGQIYLSPSITNGVLQDYVKLISMSVISTEPILTTREREILQHIVEGKQNKEIAAILGVSVKTIETHRQRLMIKLDINSIAGLTKYALNEGLISLERLH